MTDTETENRTEKKTRKGSWTKGLEDRIIMTDEQRWKQRDEDQVSGTKRQGHREQNNEVEKGKKKTDGNRQSAIKS